MTNLGLIDLVLLSATCFCLALALLWTLDRLLQRRLDRAETAPEAPTAAHFLLRNDTISDQDYPIVKCPGSLEPEPETWSDLRAWLGNRFGPLPETLERLSETGPIAMPALDCDDLAVLRLSANRTARRVVLEDPDIPDPLFRHRTRMVEHTLASRLHVLENIPCAVAVIDAETRISWSNKQFDCFSPEDVNRMLATIPLLPGKNRMSLPALDTDKPRHVQLSYLTQGLSGVLYVSDVTEVAQAETVRREFIQTLTKTFANLTTGLAVFDRHRRLALFNPALLDLTRLSATFLSAQPPLTEFFDRLRDNKMLPEPRNYGTWRSQIDHMITSATDGLYLEDWHLVNGLTYRVTGRPHPDGAVAFLFEDISDEVAMTRQIRTQLDVRQAALDTMERAIAVIGPDQSVLLCNKPCSDLLGIDPDASFADMALTEFLSACQVRLPQEKFWGRVRNAVLERKELESMLTDTDGSRYRCRVVRIPGKKMKISINLRLETLPVLAAEVDMPG